MTHEAPLTYPSYVYPDESIARVIQAATHIFNALTFALASVLIAGVNLYALALVLQNLLGWSLFLAIVVAAGFVLVYITIGGLSILDQSSAPNTGTAWQYCCYRSPMTQSRRCGSGTL